MAEEKRKKKTEAEEEKKRCGDRPEAIVHHRMLHRPDDARTIERVVTALGDQPRGTVLIVAGDFNTDLGEMANDGRGTEIAEVIMEAGLEDMTAHFLPRKRRWGR